MNRNLTRAVWIIVCMAMLALVPARAQRVDTGQAVERGDRPKLHRMGNNAIAGHYIVVMDVDAAGAAGDFAASAARATEMSTTFGGAITHVYAHAINGFSAWMSDDRAVALSDDPRVKFVEEDSIMRATVTQTNPPWGLDRIGQTNLPLNQTYSYTSTGAGVNAYIIDTGIRITHTQFGGRASVGFDAIGDGRNGIDCNGHGTHVSGTVGGSTYGVAKNVRLFAVRVLDCNGSGSNAGVIAGVDWVTAHHVSPAVANMSLGGGVSTALDTAVRNSIASGVTYSIAAGNSNTNAGQLVAGPRRRGDHRRGDDHDRCPLVVLQLRKRGGHLRARLRHPVRVEHQRHGDQHDQRNVDGHAARHGCRRPVPAKQPDRIAGRGTQRARGSSDPQPPHRHPVGHGEPAAVLVERTEAHLHG